MKVMKKLLFLLIGLVLCCLPAHAKTTWYVYVSTDPAHFGPDSERVISSTNTVKVPFPGNGPALSCRAFEPYYFQPDGFPYPLVIHRYLECDLGKEFAVATEVGCGLQRDDVQEAILVLQTPLSLYGVSFQCANFIEDGKK
jgi:hypothetical protein